MVVQIEHLASEVPTALKAMLDRWDWKLTGVKVDEITELSDRTRHRVLLVPMTLMAAPGWPKWRVFLGRSQRKVIFYGEQLNSARLMSAVRDGAHDVLDLADPPSRWKEAIESAAAAQSLWLDLYGGAPVPLGKGLIGRSSAMQAIRQTIDRIGPTDVSVLITGESGVGKEKVAEALHRVRGVGRLVAINCAAIPRDLLEAELFGVEKGAFTGAIKTRAGLVQEAEGGTLFLDEIGEMPLELQPKLLRFLETRRARHVGGDREWTSNVRVLSATNRSLTDEIQKGHFRGDLFYRLSEVTLQVAPLRHRLEDLPILARYFMELANERFGRNIEQLEPDLLERMKGYAWPGNVRELKGAIDRLCLMHDGPVIRAGWWDPPEGSSSAQLEYHPQPKSHADLPGPHALEGSFEARLPDRAGKMELARHYLQNENRSQAWVSAQLGIHPTTLYRWRKGGRI